MQFQSSFYFDAHDVSSKGKLLQKTENFAKMFFRISQTFSQNFAFVSKHELKGSENYTKFREKLRKY